MIIACDNQLRYSNYANGCNAYIELIDCMHAGTFICKCTSTDRSNKLIGLEF